MKTSVSACRLLTSCDSFPIRISLFSFVMNLDAATATVFSNIIPVVSLLAGVLILGEPFSMAYLAGIVLILLGVYKVNEVTGNK